MSGDLDMVGIGERLLTKAQGIPDVSEAEAYMSSNVLTMARIETLAAPGAVGRPSIQQLKRLTDVGASVRIVIDGAVGQSATNDLSPSALDALVERAVGSARIMTPDPNFVSLPKPLDRRGPTLVTDKEILAGSVEDRLADAAEAAISSMEEGLELAGSIIAVGSEVAVVNSNGIDLRDEVDTFSVAQFTVEQMEGSTWAGPQGGAWGTWTPPMQRTREQSWPVSSPRSLPCQKATTTSSWGSTLWRTSWTT
jgi:predicted Zn-dependent protease